MAKDREQASSRDSPNSAASAMTNAWDFMGSFVASLSPAVSPLQGGASPDVELIPKFPCVIFRTAPEIKGVLRKGKGAPLGACALDIPVAKA